MHQINWQPTDRDLRTFGNLLGIFLLAICGYVFWKHSGYQPWMTAVGIITFILLGLANGVPQSLKWLYLGWMLAVFPIGWLITHLLLAIIFFGLFTPLGLIMRMVSGDPLASKVSADCKSYWRPFRQTESIERYFRQY